MPIFSHRYPAPLTTPDYRRFRPYIREDFHGCCAFCLLTELFAGGKENFELDHFHPKSLREDLIAEYTNLYYACHVCNHTKLDIWPSGELQARGFRFFDSCSDEFSEHFADVDGEWIPLTSVGQYSIERLRLNRKHLLEIRRIINSLAGDGEVDWNKPLAHQIAGTLPMGTQ